MKPRPYVQIQAVMAALAAVVVLAVLGRPASLPVAVFFTVALFIWLYFSFRYLILLRRDGDRRSGNRRGRDKVMLGCLLGGLVLPAILAWLEFTILEVNLFEKPPLRDGEAVIASVALLAIPLGILVSSSVDWYLIRPFREGVYNEPVCRPEVHEQGRGMDYARYWIMHRMVSEFSVYAGIVILLGLFFSILSTAVRSEEGKGAIGFVGGLGIAVWSVSELAGLRAALKFVRYPYCELGGWVAGKTVDCTDISGFVLDVSIDPGVQLIEEPRGYPARDIANKHRSIPLKQAHNIEPIEQPYRLCSEKCEFWVPDCEIGLRERDPS